MSATTTTDDRDARGALYRDSLDASAEEIRRRHEQMMRDRDIAISETEKVCHEAFDIAVLVSAVHKQVGGRRFAEWWREKNMPVGWADRYLKLARTAGRRDLPDKDQLRLIGVLPEPEESTIGQHKRQPNPFAWIKWSAKITRNFPAEAVETMDEADRIAALKHLQPIKELIAKLEHPTTPGKEAPTAEK